MNKHVVAYFGVLVVVSAGVGVSLSYNLPYLLAVVVGVGMFGMYTVGLREGRDK